MSEVISSDLSASDKDSWSTDPRVFAYANQFFNFSLDVAASNNNYKCANFITQDEDALNLDWKERIESEQGFSIGLNAPLNAWCNPPYSRGMIVQFMYKAIEEAEKGVTTVLLVPSTLDAMWLPLKHVSELWIVVKGRLSFVHPVTGKPIQGNTKGSMFVVIGPGDAPLVTRYIDRDIILTQGESLTTNNKEVA